MYLEKLKIYGFKSFADEIKFEFSPGMTVIVGPNGCGKSNVLDAMNWVVGEQSAGRLRGNKMEDMIFMGSKTRKPLGVTSVELRMDNSTGFLPVDYDKVSVMRKLYRSGESEYYINRNPCRLKDIKELFMDTGVGTRSYSVMDQGNVNFILKCSPEERRGIIEEAAGIRKYKERKENAKRRLERTRHDLNEVKNILAEVKKNIRRLKRQSARASRFRNYKKKLSYLEVSRLCQEYENIKDSLNVRKEESGNITEKLASLSSEKSRIDSQLTAKEEKKSELDNKIIKLSRQSFQLDSKIEIINSRVNDFDSQLSRLEQEINRNSESAGYCSSRLKQLKEELKEFGTLSSNKPEKEMERINSLLNSKNSDIQERESNIKKIKDDIEKLERELSLSKARLSDFNAKIESQTASQKTLSAKEKELNKNLEKIKDELSKRNTLLENFKSKESFCRKKTKEIQDRLVNTEDIIAKLKVKREKYLAQFHKTKSEFDSGKKYLPQLLSMEELARKGIKGVDGPIFSLLEKELSDTKMKDIAYRAGEKTSWMIAEDINAAKKAITFLKDKNLPPLTFLLIDRIDEKACGLSNENNSDNYFFKKIVSFIVRDIEVKEELIYFREMVVAGGGDVPPRGGRLLGLEKNIKDFEKLLKTTEKDIETRREQKEELVCEIKEVKKESASLAGEISKLNQEKSNFKGRAEFMKSELAELREKLKKIPDRDFLLKKCDKEAKNAENLSLKIQGLKDDLSGFESKLSNLNAQTAALEAEKKMIFESLRKKKNRSENIKKRISDTKEEEKRIEKLIKDLEAQRKNLISRNSDDIKTLSQLNEEKKRIQATSGELENERSLIKDKIKGLKETQKSRGLELQQCKETAAQERQAEEILREKIKNIKVRLQEDMNTDLQEALKDYRSQPVREEEIFKLKKKLENVGKVNLQAPEEFEKENQRFEFIKKHVDDLEESDRNLNGIIKKINARTKERFLNNFNEINDNFNRIFNRLFEGGRAELYLTDPEDILESGVEITAKPEGKKIN
ncbi:MAG: AAA family ATPase, partial [Elusimicrobiota bacterium]